MTRDASSKSTLTRYGPWFIAAAGLGIVLLYLASLGIAATAPNELALRLEFLMTGVGISLIGLNEAIPPDYPRLSLGVRVGLYLCGAFLITVLILHLTGIQTFT